MWTISVNRFFLHILRISTLLFSRDALHRDSKNALIYTKSFKKLLRQANCPHALTIENGFFTFTFLLSSYQYILCLEIAN